MSLRIVIHAGELRLHAELYENETARAILDALPIEGRANRWGDEVYFSIPVQLDLMSDARDQMQVGELAFWPPGNAFCIFWGATPASEGSEPRAASKVNPFGKIEGDAWVLGAVRSGERVSVTRHES
jgi:hypothetical protein